MWYYTLRLKLHLAFTFVTTELHPLANITSCLSKLTLFQYTLKLYAMF